MYYIGTMEKKEENSGVKFIKALQECPSFVISDGESCNLDDKFDEGEYGRKIEATLQLAIDDLKNIQKRLKDTQALFPEADIRRDTLQTQLLDMEERERQTQEILTRIIKNREQLEKSMG